MNQFAVVQDAYGLPDWQLATQIILDAMGAHPTVTKQHVKRSRGLLAQNISRDAAERIRQACADRGIVAHVVPQQEVVVLPKPIRVHAMRIAPDALWIGRSSTGPQEPIDWDRLVLIAAYQVVKTEYFHRWSVNLDASSEDGMELRVEKRPQNFREHLADLISSLPDGSFLRLRLGSRELNYRQALGSDAPDPLVTAHSRVESFRLVLARIHAHASKAYVPPETLALLGGTPDPNRRLYNLPTLGEFDAYNRWLLQKIRVGSRPEES